MQKQFSTDSAEHGARQVSKYFDELAAKPRQSRHGGERTGLLALLRKTGNPHEHPRVVRVAGSKGKGSTARIMETVLTRSGVHTGVFTSPHLQHWNERIRIGGNDVDNALLAGVLAELDPDIRALRADASLAGPDFFEVCLVAALLLFRRAECTLVILECGIGARGDATALVAPILSVLTTVELEHVQLIGPGLEEVTREKAGVIRPGFPIIAGRLPAKPAQIVRAVARSNCAPLWELGRSVHIKRTTGQNRLHYKDEFGQLALEVSPSLYWLADNVAMAIAALRRLGECPNDAQIRVALQHLQLPGRLEILDTTPTLVVDGAHTLASSELLAHMLAHMPHAGMTLVLSSSPGHDPGVLSQKLWRLADHIILTRADATRSQPTQDLACRLKTLGTSPVTERSDPREAMKSAFELTPDAGMICATGSVYMAGKARTFALENGR